jgi:small-conductance mechanosensitive channel
VIGRPVNPTAAPRLHSRARLRSLAFALLVAALPLASAEAQEATAPAADPEVPTAPVRFDGRTLFSVRGSSSFPAPLRAAGIAARITKLALDSGIAPEAIVVAPTDHGLAIRAAGEILMTVNPSDAALENLKSRTLAESHRLRIASAVAQYRADRDPKKLLRGLGLSLGATALFVALVFGVNRIFRRVTAALEPGLNARIDRLPGEARGLVPRKQLWDVVAASVRGARWIALLVLLFLWLEFVLGQFPWTRPLSERLLALLVAPLEQMGTSFLDFVPSLLFLIVLALVTRYGLRLLRLYFTALARGNTALANFEPEWAMPTYKILRTLVIALAVVMAYPYVPGSGSEALQGISVLGGLMLSLGASGAVGNVIAGYFNTFGRVFRVGDIVQVGDVRGEVTEIKLLTTRIRTMKNEETTLPNATIMNTHVVNYSALAKSRGLILHTEVGIGYEVPWRQVHAMLEEAARRTPDLLREPAPFILQRQLADFAVVYQLNVYSSTAVGMMQRYSALHQHILDVFNEHGVQIMTPAYEGDPAQPKIVPRGEWFAAPAKPPTT